MTPQMCGTCPTANAFFHKDSSQRPGAANPQSGAVAGDANQAENVCGKRLSTMAFVMQCLTDFVHQKTRLAESLTH